MVLPTSALPYGCSAGFSLFDTFRLRPNALYVLAESLLSFWVAVLLFSPVADAQTGRVWGARVRSMVRASSQLSARFFIPFPPLFSFRFVLGIQ